MLQIAHVVAAAAQAQTQGNTQSVEACLWRLHPMWPFMTRTRSSSSSSCLHTLLLPQFGLCLVYMPHAARYQFSAMSPTLQVELQLQIPPASNGCQTAARQGGLGQAGRGGCCLGVHTIEVVHLAGVAACAPAPTPTAPLAIHMCVPRHHGRRCKTKQRRCDENLLPLSLLPPHVHKCISELRIVVAPRKVHTHFGIFWQFPDYPPTPRCCYCNLEKLAASHCTHAGFVSLALSLSLSTNLPMYSAYVQGLQLNVLPQYIRSIYT